MIRKSPAPLLLTAAFFGLVGVGAVSSQVILGQQDFSITVEEVAAADPFSFASVISGAGATVTSEPVLVSGFNGTLPISVSGEGDPTYSLDGDLFTSDPGVISAGMSVLVRLTASPDEGAVRTATLMVGGESGGFTVTTEDFTPNNFTFAGVTGANPSQTVSSAPQMISGIIGIAPISISQGFQAEYRIGSGEWVGEPGTIQNGQQVSVRLRSSPDFDAQRTATLTIGTVQRDFSVTTRASGPCDGTTPSVGTDCGDGSIYAGMHNGNKLFVASSNEGIMAWKTSNNYTPGTYSDDGFKNFQSLKRLGLSNFPAAEACAAKGEDWFLPSLAEFHAIRTSMTSVQLASIFVASSRHLTSETWGTGKFGTSSGGGTSPDNAGFVYFLSPTNNVTSGVEKAASNSGIVHCVRHDGTRVASDPCAGNPEVGDLCYDGTVYAGQYAGRDVFIATQNEGLMEWKTTASFTPGTYADDGFANSGAMRQIGVSQFPGMAACAARGEDWYLPGLNEFRAIRTNLGMGLRTHAFPGAGGMTGGINQLNMTSETWGTGKGGTSLSDDNRFSYAYSPSSDITNGRLMNSDINSYVHCFKTDGTRTYEDPCASGTPELGAFCDDGSIFAGNNFYVAPQSEPTLLTWKTSRTDTAGSLSLTNGVANTNAIAAAGLSVHPAAQACREKGPGWYLPAAQQLSTAFTNLNGRPKALRHAFNDRFATWHWSSTQMSSNAGAADTFSPSGSINAHFKDTALGVRCAFDADVQTSITLSSGSLPQATQLTTYGPFDFKSLATVIGGTLDNPVTSADSTWSVSAGSLPSGFSLSAQGVLSGSTPDLGSFTFMVSASVGEASAEREYTVTVGMQQPDPFTISPLVAAPGATITSAAVRVQGFSGSPYTLPISISGQGNPSYSLDGVNFTSSPGVVTSGTDVFVRLDASAGEGETRQATLTVSGVSANFVVTTADFTPDNFSFTANAAAAPGSIITSNTQTINGVAGDVPISISQDFEAEYQIGAGSWTSSPGTIQNGQQVSVRLRASSTVLEQRSVTLTVGTVQRDFSVTTKTPSIYIGSTEMASGGSVATFPPHEPGDLIIAYAWRVASRTAPSTPAGWTWLTSPTAGTTTTNGAALTVAYRNANTSCAANCNVTTGVFTNATRVVFVIYRNAGVPAVASIGRQGQTNVTYPANDTFPDAARTLTFLGHRNVNMNIIPSGTVSTRYTVDNSWGTMSAAHTTGNTPGFGQQTLTFSGSLAYITTTIRLP
jgi:hypothetical protein